jgi:biopolymer transport protein ExbB
MFGNMSIIQVFQSSMTMVVLLLCSIVTFAFVVERSLYFRVSACNVRRFMQELTSQMKAGNPRAALEYCQKQNKPIARVMAQALTTMNRSREEQTQRLETAIELEQVEMERHLGVLGTMANIAPLLGLFGTVVGIIRAFADIARTGSGGGAVVAMGVSEALLTTAAGIIIAVLATVAFNFFVRRVRTRVAQLEDARETWFTLWHQYHRQSRAEASPAHAPAASASKSRPEPVLS